MNKDPKTLAVLAVGGIVVLLGGTWLLGKIMHKDDPDPLAYEEDLPPVLDYDLDFEVPTDLDPTPVDPVPDDPAPDPVTPDPSIATNTTPTDPVSPSDPVTPLDPTAPTRPADPSVHPNVTANPPTPDPPNTDPTPTNPIPPVAANEPPTPTPVTPTPAPVTPPRPTDPVLPPVASNPPPTTDTTPPERPADPVRPSPGRPNDTLPPSRPDDSTASRPTSDPIKPTPVRPDPVTPTPAPRPAVVLKMAEVESAPGTNRGTLLQRSRYLVSIDQMNAFRAVEGIPARTAAEGDSNIATATWEEAVAFTAWLTQSHRNAKLIGADTHYRLPTTRETRSTTIWRHDDNPTHSNTRRPVGIVLAQGAKP